MTFCDIAKVEKSHVRSFITYTRHQLTDKTHSDADYEIVLVPGLSLHWYERNQTSTVGVCKHEGYLTGITCLTWLNLSGVYKSSYI